jgi:hypothetical protein
MISQVMEMSRAKGQQGELEGHSETFHDGHWERAQNTSFLLLYNNQLEKKKE